MGKSKKKQAKEPKEEVFHVECILAARVESMGEVADWVYFIMLGFLRVLIWCSFIWEPASGVANCQQLLKRFWQHVGTDNEDYQTGYEIHAKEGWIRQEKAQFKKKFGKEIEREQTKGDFYYSR
ncbi:hypothetical protein ARMSODRAFT_259656 [Armillaria solidipes]|uniref:Uncharacterized protein n=1 Tax=Armillaria solidipes TaxID=1076256 RepID=A0A2H3C6X2_9AGAR|nr:hypothetical protein ARMSODRAFT_259656 [Armillaria solidipes]